jgi:hypothetical protein
VPQGRVQCRAVVDTVVKLRIPLKVGRIALLNVVSYFLMFRTSLPYCTFTFYSSFHYVDFLLNPLGYVIDPRHITVLGFCITAEFEPGTTRTRSRSSVKNRNEL